MKAQHRVGRLLGQLSGDRHSEQQLTAETTSTKAAPAAETKAPNPDTLSVLDNRTGKSYTIPVRSGTINAQSLWQLKAGPKMPGIRSYDPGYLNTCSATSRITYIHGGKGLLRYRGYPIEQLAEKSTFMEVAYLLIYGQLPDKAQLSYWTSRIMRHTFVHEDLKGMMKNFRYDAHPMGMLISSVSAMSTFHPEANPCLAGQDVYNDIELRNKQIHRILGTIATVAAFAYRHRIGRPYVDPAPAESGFSYPEGFLFMLDKMSQPDYKPHPRLARALDILFILHADHELNCSTAAMRHLASSGVDVYTCIAGSAAALYGPRHGGANEAVLRMLEQIKTKENIPKFIEQVKAKKVRLMGFGHRVYKNYDPRARIIRTVAEEVFSILGKEPLIEVAVELEKHALSDPYFIERKLYPNVDFYSGLIYKAMGFPTDFFPVLFTIPRTAGWLAHWNEFLDDPENKIVRPRQVYVGSGPRDYAPLDGRTSTTTANIQSRVTAEAKRREARA
jgi:citrate synthase